MLPRTRIIVDNPTMTIASKRSSLIELNEFSISEARSLSVSSNSFNKLCSSERFD